MEPRKVHSIITVENVTKHNNLYMVTWKYYAKDYCTLSISWEIEFICLFHHLKDEEDN